MYAKVVINIWSQIVTEPRTCGYSGMGFWFLFPLILM